MSPETLHIGLSRWRHRSVTALVCLVISTSAFAQRASEFEVKAVFLYNFTKFVGWSPAALGNESEPFVVGILGENPFGTSLAETIRGEKAFGKKMVIRQFSHPGEIDTCHLLYIHAARINDEVLKRLQRKGVLTVGEDPDFCRNGGIIRFFSENETIRLEISPDAARAANLTISSKLLRIAKICP